MPERWPPSEPAPPWPDVENRSVQFADPATGEAKLCSANDFRTRNEAQPTPKPNRNRKSGQAPVPGPGIRSAGDVHHSLRLGLVRNPG